MYFVLYNSDGDTNVQIVDQDELERRLNEQYYGEHPIFLESIPSDDTNYWPEDSYLIIKGQIVVPRAEQVVTRYNVGSYKNSAA